MGHREASIEIVVLHSPSSNLDLFMLCSQISFLPCSGKGFSLDYPSLSLHAISRSIPAALEAAAAASASSSISGTSIGCLYCQLEGVEDDEQEESIFPEIWILPTEQDSCEGRERSTT